MSIGQLYTCARIATLDAGGGVTSLGKRLTQVWFSAVQAMNSNGGALRSASRSINLL